MSETPRYFLQLSEQALEDIEKMVESGVSVRPLYNRLYYAVFYSAKAGLLSEGFEPRTHRGQHPRPSKNYKMKKKQSNGRKPYYSRGYRRRGIWRTTSWR